MSNKGKKQNETFSYVKLFTRAAQLKSAIKVVRYRR